MDRLPAVTDSPNAWAMLDQYDGALAFDVGANIGQAAAVLSKHFERVVSFEPCEESAFVLRGEKPSNVEVWPVALSDHDGEVVLDETLNSIKTGQLTTGTGLGWGPIVGERSVYCMTIDTVVAQVGAPDLVKVDTEGHEVQVLRGAKGLISARGTVFLVEVHSHWNEAPIRRMFDGWKVETVRHQFTDDPNHFYLRVEP